MEGDDGGGVSDVKTCLKTTPGGISAGMRWDPGALETSERRRLHSREGPHIVDNTQGRILEQQNGKFEAKGPNRKT